MGGVNRSKRRELVYSERLTLITCAGAMNKQNRVQTGQNSERGCGENVGWCGGRQKEIIQKEKQFLRYILRIPKIGQIS